MCPHPIKLRVPSLYLLSVSPKFVKFSKAKESLASSRTDHFAAAIPHRQ
jgi:hypothetical protein